MGGFTSMIDYYVQVWYFVIFIPVSIAAYFALMAIDFSKIFKNNSTWQIRVITLLISISLGFIIADGVLGIITRLISTI